MQLSLWMIYNQLYDYEVSMNINQTSNTMYNSIRLNKKEGCLTASQKGDDVLVYSKYECLTIKNVNVMDIFSVVQDIFDDYDHWANEITVSIRDTVCRLHQRLIHQTPP